MIASDTRKFCKFYLSKEEYDLNINFNIIKFYLLSETEKCEHYADNGISKLIIDDKLEIIISDYTMNLPPVFDENFIKLYDHKTNCIINKSDISSVLTFLNTYIAEASNFRVYLVIEDDKELQIKIDEPSKNLMIKKSLPIVSMDKELIGIKIPVNHNTLKLALDHLKLNEKIKFQINKDAIAMNISNEGDEDNNHIIVVKMAE